MLAYGNAEDPIPEWVKEPYRDSEIRFIIESSNFMIYMHSSGGQIEPEILDKVNELRQTLIDDGIFIEVEVDPLFIKKTISEIGGAYHMEYRYGIAACQAMNHDKKFLDGEDKWSIIFPKAFYQSTFGGLPAQGDDK